MMKKRDFAPFAGPDNSNLNSSRAQLRPMKAHGCERPFNSLQIASWVSFMVFFLAYFLIQLPALDESSKVCIFDYLLYFLQIGFTAVFLTSCLAVVVLDLIATFSVPTDPMVLKERLFLALHKKFDAQAEIKDLKEGEQLLFCYLCKAHCLEPSKHCSACNRCIFEFDHHCQWLNNCIGSSNYKYFMGLIVATTTMILVHMLICCYTLACYFQDSNTFTANIQRYFYSADDFDA